MLWVFYIFASIMHENESLLLLWFAFPSQHVMFASFHLCIAHLISSSIYYLLIFFVQFKTGLLIFSLSIVGVLKYNKNIRTLTPWPLHVLQIFSPYMICFQLCLFYFSKKMSLFFIWLNLSIFLASRFLTFRSLFRSLPQYTHTAPQGYTKDVLSCLLIFLIFYTYYLKFSFIFI